MSLCSWIVSIQTNFFKFRFYLNSRCWHFTVFICAWKDQCSDKAAGLSMLENLYKLRWKGIDPQSARLLLTSCLPFSLTLAKPEGFMMDWVSDAALRFLPKDKTSIGKLWSQRICENAMVNPITVYANQKLILKEKAGWGGSSMNRVLA